MTLAVKPRPKLGRWAAELDRVLAANATKTAREQLTLVKHSRITLRQGGFIDTQIVQQQRQLIRVTGVSFALVLIRSGPSGKTRPYRPSRRPA